MNIDFSSISSSWNYIWAGAAYTLELTAITAVGGLFLGTLLALCHISNKPWLLTSQALHQLDAFSSFGACVVLVFPFNARNSATHFRT